MKFQLLGDWPCQGGALFVPAGTVIDGNDPKWLGAALPKPMPMNAKALDQDAYDALCLWYQHHLHLLQYAAGIKPRTSAEMPMWLTDISRGGGDKPT